MTSRKLLYPLFSLMMLVGVFLTGCKYEAPKETAKEGASQTTTAPASPEATVTADEIKVGIDVNPGTMDPRLARETSAFRVVELVYDGLVRLNNKLEPQPGLAEKWENPDATTWVFTLRKGVTFHDGTPFTAEDVKYTYDTLLDPAMKASQAKLYEAIDKVEVIDPGTVKFVLKQPYAPLLSYLDLGIVPKHIAEKKDDSLASKPIGTGPYKMLKWDNNSKIAFEAFDNYWAGTPKTKKVTYFIIPDHTTRMSALEAGDVDLIQSPLPPQDIAKMRANSNFTTIETEGLGYTYLNFNTTNPILADVKVRQAIAHLVDKKLISEELYNGIDKPAASPLIPASWAYTDQIKGYEYDPVEAKALFEEAGWKDTNGDGILDKDGKKLTITLSTYTEDASRMQAVEYLQNEFAKAGIDAKVFTAEFVTFLANLQSQKYDIALNGWLNLSDPDRAVYRQFQSQSENNFGKYSNPKVDELLEQGRSTLKQEDRAKIYQEIAQIVTEEVAYEVILSQAYIAIYTNKLAGYQENPSGSLYGLKDAELKK